MNEIKLPKHFNYIGVFLTFQCSLKCSYCINKYNEFGNAAKHMSIDDWEEVLLKIKTTPDLPFTFQGGEPTRYAQFYELVNRLAVEGKHMDLLTNGEFDTVEFMKKIKPRFFSRKAKYACIRFSLHEGTKERQLVQKAWTLKQAGYSVGVWGLDCEALTDKNNLTRDLCNHAGVDFRLKEFLSRKSGTYKYPYGLRGKCQTVNCTPSELLISPNGYVYACHSKLYTGIDHAGHILDKCFKIPEKKKCISFGMCNPCDMKLKTNRHQQQGHCSVVVEPII